LRSRFIVVLHGISATDYADARYERAGARHNRGGRGVGELVMSMFSWFRRNHVS